MKKKTKSQSIAVLDDEWQGAELVNKDKAFLQSASAKLW